MDERDSVLASGFIPTEPEEITAQWLFEVINQYREVKELSLLKKPEDILECEINERMTSRGYVSSTYNINIRFKCYTTMGLEESDYSFFVKMMPSSHIYYNERGKFIAQSTGSFKREIETNFRFLRALDRFVSEESAVTGGEWAAIRTPEIVYGSHDRVGNGVIVWINETAAHGFKPTNHCRGLTLMELSCVVVRLAEFHAAATAFLAKTGDQNLPGQFPELSKGVDLNGPTQPTSDESQSEAKEEASRLIKEMTFVFRDFCRFVRRLPGHLHAFKACDQARQSMVETMVHSSRRHSFLPLRTIIHGELWEKNILLHRRSHFEMPPPEDGGHSPGKNRKVFDPKTSLGQHNGSSLDPDELRTEEDKEFLASRFEHLQASSGDLPYDVMLSDWKWSTVGSPTFDLATLMLSATPSKEFRDAYVKPLLQTYHRVFTGALSSRYGLEYPSFTCEDLVKDYEMSLHGAFLKAVSSMTIEVKNLESDFYYVKEEYKEEKDRAGQDLRDFGRRFVDLIDEHVPSKLTSNAWTGLQAKLAKEANNNNNLLQSGNMNNFHQQSVTIHLNPTK